MAQVGALPCHRRRVTRWLLWDFRTTKRRRQGTGILLLFVVSVFQSAALAPLAPLTDTLALASAAPHLSEGSAQQRFHYGWLRGAGSAAFICGTLLSGEAIAQFGINAAVWLNAGLLTAAALPLASCQFCRCRPRMPLDLWWPMVRSGASELCCGSRSTAGSYLSRP
jgi:MFS family permease